MPRNSSTTSTRSSHGSAAGFRGTRGATHGSRAHAPRRSPSRPRAAAPARTPSLFDTLPIQVVPTENLPSFAELGLPRPLVDALARGGIATPFPIQAATVPDVLAGRDVLGRASTGAGKTLAFGLPLLARLIGAKATPRHPRALVLVPTRELAMQVTDALSGLGQALGVSTRLVAGGLPIGKQINALERGVDILVATPGRLIDLIERRSCYLDEIEITVLDEADHMADLGFLPVVRQLLDQTPAGGQRLLFSATLDGDVATLIEHYLSDPAAHALNSVAASVDTMTHHLFRVRHEDKVEIAGELASRPGRTLLFVRTKHGADRLARQLGRVGVSAGALHGGRTQAQRTRALDAFKDGSVPVLVATDVAARGIHVEDISLVVHVDPPADSKDYLHRSGRTARAGESGMVVVLTAAADEAATRKMLTAAGVAPTQRDVRPGQPDVFELTGARTPSGVPVRPRPERPNRPAGGQRPRGTTHGRTAGVSRGRRPARRG